MDFSSCYGEPGVGMLKNCKYTVNIENNHQICPVELVDGDCPIEKENKSFNIGFKDDNIYFYFPQEIKKYSVQIVDDGVFLLSNQNKECSSTLINSDPDPYYQTENPCEFK